MNAPEAQNVLKVEYPALLEPGIKYMSMDLLKSIAVEPFPESVRRPMLFDNLTLWMTKCADLGMKGEIWIDGSFTTEKTDPDDIDCVVIIDAFPSNPTSEQIQTVEAHLDRRLVRISHSLDLYPLVAHDLEQHQADLSYWRGWFGYQRDGCTAKGIARIQL